MNKKKHLIKDYKKRLEYKNKEILRLKYLMIKNNNILPLNIRMLANDEFDNLKTAEIAYSQTLQHRKAQWPGKMGHTAPKGFMGERSKIRNRCILTGRSRGIIKEWQISRIKFKLLADQGLIPGIRRASW